MIEGQTAFMWQYKVNKQKDMWVAMNSWFCIQVSKSKVYSLIYEKKWSSGNADTVFFLLKNPNKSTKTSNQQTNQNFSTSSGAEKPETKI